MEIGQKKRVDWARYYLEGKYYTSRYVKSLYITSPFFEDELYGICELPTCGSWIAGWENVWT